MEQPLALRGRLPASLSKDTVEETAWMVWQVARELAAKRNVDPTPCTEQGWGVPGFRVSRSFRSILFDLYPEARRLSDHDVSLWSQPVYAFLRASTNAVCLDRDAHPPVWWVRDVWSESVGVPVYRHLEPTGREKRLTPAEVGEDRDPAPVEVRWRCPHDGCDFEAVGDGRVLGSHIGAMHGANAEVEVCPEPGCGREIKGRGPMALHQRWHRDQARAAAEVAKRASVLDTALEQMRVSLSSVVAVAVEEATASLRAELAEVTAERDRLKERLARITEALG